MRHAINFPRPNSHPQSAATPTGAAVRGANLQAALNLLRDGHSLTSPELARKLDVHLSTVTRLMGSLRRAGLVEGERGESDGTVGRPPNLWRLNGEAGYILGLAMHADVLSGVLVDLSGRVLARRRLSCDPPLTTHTVPRALADLALSLAGDVPAERVLGVGVAASGIIDPERGVIWRSGGLRTEQGDPAIEYPLREYLERFLPWPVRVANDTHLAALALFRHRRQSGELPADASLLYLMAGESLWAVGVGIVLDGRLYAGEHGTAGELVHPVFMPRPPGCHELARRALAGDPEAVEAALVKLRPVLDQLAALALALDPACVVLGGAFSTLGPRAREAFTSTVRSTNWAGVGAFWGELLDSLLVFDPLWPDTEAFGAAELMLEDLFRSTAMGAEAGPLVQVALRV